LITGSEAEYEALAVALAREPERLRELRARLQICRLAGPPFITSSFARDLERAFEAMWAFHQAGRRLEALYIQKDSSVEAIV
jgi:predicted O-linked N-acetylglucosamine transferase (SPINDLY family)